jgi:predicted small secreted protein
MIGDTGFMSGVCCGVILGAAAIALVVALLLESEQRKNDRALRRIRKLWEE